MKLNERWLAKAGFTQWSERTWDKRIPSTHGGSYTKIKVFWNDIDSVNPICVTALEIPDFGNIETICKEWFSNWSDALKKINDLSSELGDKTNGYVTK